MLADRMRILLWVALVFAVLTFILPVFFIITESLSGPGAPYTPYLEAFTNPLNRSILWRTIRIAFVVAVLTALIGYPLAYTITLLPPRLAALARAVTIFPLATSAVVRTFGWIVLLGRNGPINLILVKIGITEEPIILLFREPSLVLGLTQVFLPFFVLPTLASLLTIDRSMIEASYSLGMTPVATFFRITFPLSIPGVLGGTLIVMALSMSAFVTQSLLGGAMAKMMTPYIYDRIKVLAFTPAAALSMILLCVALIGAFAYLLLAQKVRNA
jgi:putative spermidine/putrescine transport system permease protein